MRNRIATFVGIAALIIGGVIFVSAQSGQGEGGRPPQQRGDRPFPPPPPPPPPGVPDIEHLTRALNLTDAQAAELKPFLDAERPVVDALMKKLEEQHRQIEAATAEGHFDEAQVRSLAGQQAQTMTDLIVEQERVKSKIYNALTPEQRAKAEEMHKRGGPHGRRPGPPDGPPPPPPPGQ
jgi:Spy/CpxP family protein refolding chaperone